VLGSNVTSIAEVVPGLLLSLVGISLTSASLVAVLITVGLREDIFPGMKGVFLRSGSLTVIFLLTACVLLMLELSGYTSAGLAFSIGLASFFAAIASLISIAVFFARVSLSLGGDKKWANFLLSGSGYRIAWFIFFLALVALFITSGFASGWRATPTWALGGLAVGHLLCGCAMRNYIRYDIGDFKECFSAEEFYQELQAVVEESTELRITSTTPGLVLISEYAPENYPMPGERKYPGRTELVELYLMYARKGVRIKYLVGKQGITDWVKKYKTIDKTLRMYSEYRNASEQLFKRVYAIKNIELRYLSLAADSDFVTVSLISDKAVVFSNRDRLTKKIKHGDIVRDTSLAKRLIKRFDSREHWDSAKEFTLSEFQRLWE